MTKKPNILLIICDQYRSDCFSFKGHPDVLTPNLDDLASRSINFENMYSLVPSCIPARTTLHTGLSAKEHKRVGYQDGVNWDFNNFLAQELSNQGYHTECIGKMHVHPPRKSCGFNNIQLHDGYLAYYRNKELPYFMHQNVTDDYLQVLRQHKGPLADITLSGIDPNSWISYPWPYEEDLHPTNWVVNQSLRFLETRDREKPFFLMASFVKPHQPFDPPKAFLDLYKDKKLRAPYLGNWEKIENTLQNQNHKDSIFGTTNADYMDMGMKGYYSNITHLDSQIGRLILGLQEEGLYEDTLIVFTSDHGEQLFDHYTFRKVFPYQGSIQVPLLVKVPPEVTINPDSLVSLEDVYQLLIKQDITVLNNNKEYLHGEHAFSNQCSHQFIVTKTDKYIWYSETGKEQYFNLEIDPHELNNEINNETFKERINTLRKWLIEEIKDRQEGFVQNNELKPVSTIVNILD